ncbi:MAG: hypothetical protein QXW79_01620 [Thermoplasmata archaeon]
MTLKFIFEFIDHDEKKCLEVNVEVQFNTEEQKHSYTKETKSNVEDKIYNFVNDKHFKSEQPQGQKGGTHKKFGDYKIKKIKRNIQSKEVNISYEDPTNEKLIYQSLCEKTRFTYCRGNRSSKWSEIYSYKKEVYHYIFVYEDLSNPICNYKIERMLSKPTSKTTTIKEIQTKASTNMTGGSESNYANKYLKYKSKYMNLKRNFY